MGLVIEDLKANEVDETERSVQISEQLTEQLVSLWDPIPITPTTYISRPLLPRSVRTIDLSAPVASSELRLPVSIYADETEDMPRAVGE